MLLNSSLISLFLFSFNVNPSSTTRIITTYSSSSSSISHEVIKREARGLNNVDLGEVQEANETIAVTKRDNIGKVLSSQVYATWI